MDFWQYLIVTIISFLGLGTGLIVAFVSKEEIIQGQTYFKWLKRILLVIITATIFIFYKLYIYGIIATLIMIAWLYFFRNKKTGFASYAILGMLLAASAKNISLLATTSILIFFFGHAQAGTFLYRQKKSKIPEWKEYFQLLQKLLLKNLHFIALAIILYLIF